jgi:hypothetical protein
VINELRKLKKYISLQYQPIKTKNRGTDSKILIYGRKKANKRSINGNNRESQW